MNKTEMPIAEQDIYKKLSCGYYDKVDMPFPSPLQKPRLPLNHTSAEALEYSKALAKYEDEKNDYEANLKKYYTLKGELQVQFEKDALDEVGLTGHPRAGKAWSYAWQQGHSAGFGEVLGYLRDISDVLIGE